MKRLLTLILLSAVSVLAQSGGLLPQTPTWIANRQGYPAGGALVAVCQPLATTAATLTSTIATFTMASNPITAGFVSGMQVQIAGFTGGDTYFNNGTLSDGSLTGGIDIILVTSTQIIVGPIAHVNGVASTNGTLLQVGNSNTPCAGLSTLYTDSSLTTTTTNPLTADGLGNYAAGASIGIYYAQIYGSGITTTIRQVEVPTYSSGGSSSVSGQANGVIPLGTTATTITQQSHMDDGVTTASTITSTEPVQTTGMAYPVVTITQFGSSGTSIYNYVISGTDANGLVRTVEGYTNNGNASLSGSNYNIVTVAAWSGIAPSGSCNVYRVTGSGTTLGKIGTITSCSAGGNIYDTGTAGDTTSPPSDTSGALTVQAANIDLAPTTTSTNGVLFQAGVPFLHTYGSNQNIFMGPGAGNFTMAGTTVSNGSATSDICIGYQPCQAITTAYEMTCIGWKSCQSATTAWDLTGLGPGTLQADTSGKQNTALGNFSMFVCTTCNNNVAVGGDVLSTNLHTGDENTGVGEEALYQVSDGSSDNTCVGFESCNSTASYNYNTALGAYALQTTINATGGNTAVGGHALAGLTGSYNVAVGRNAGIQATGSNSDYIGFQSGSNDSGSGNTYVGDSVASGCGSGCSGSNNVGVGQTSFNNLTSGATNTAVGQQALRYLTTGSNNTAVGSLAGSTSGDTTATQGVYLGATAAPGATGLTNAMGLGYGAAPSTSNTAVVGNASVTDTYFGGTGAATTGHMVGLILNGATVKGISFTTTPVNSNTGQWSAVAQNATKLESIYITTYVGLLGNLAYSPSTADNTANVYDIGIYGPGCLGGATNVPLVVHTGPVAGTTLFSTTGSRTAVLSGSPVTVAMPPGWYCFAYTSSAASPAAVFGGDAVNIHLKMFTDNTAPGGSTGTTSSGTLNSTITAPATAASLGATGLLAGY